MYRYVIFDLDGTLLNTLDDLADAGNHVCAAHGWPTHPVEAYKHFVGNGVPKLVERFSPEEARSAPGFDAVLKEFVAYYDAHKEDKTAPYPGIPELLSALKAAGKTVVLATSKPEGFAVEILRHFGLYDYFDIIAGASMDESRNKKADVIAYAISQMKNPDLSRMIMIGDREHDILGAKQIGIDSIGVLYGYGDRAEHENAGATYIAEKVEDILPLLN